MLCNLFVTKVVYYGKVLSEVEKLKKVISVILIMFLIFLSTPSYAELYGSLPVDIGSNSKIMEILYPEEKQVTTYSETYLISCMAEPGTEITLYERYDDSLFVPLMVNNEAVTGTVGESGLYLIDLTLKKNSQNRIMFFAQNGSKYQSEFRSISVEEEEEELEKVEYTALDIKEFVTNIKNSAMNN